MKDFTVERPEKCADTARFESVEDGIYRDLNGDPDDHLVTLSFTSEEGEGQYPIEDLLDEYGLYVSEFVTDAPDERFPNARVTLEFAGDLEGARKAAALVGKRVRNETVVEDGDEAVTLVIE